MEYTYSDELYSDLHKDALGSRPHEGGYLSWNAKTPDEKQVEWNWLCDRLVHEENERKEREARAVVKFEETVRKIIGAGAMDRKTAIKWLIAAEGRVDALHDLDYFCFLNGLPYSYLDKEGL